MDRFPDFRRPDLFLLDCFDRRLLDDFRRLDDDFFRRPAVDFFLRLEELFLLECPFLRTDRPLFLVVECFSMAVNIFNCFVALAFVVALAVLCFVFVFMTKYVFVPRFFPIV